MEELDGNRPQDVSGAWIDDWRFLPRHPGWRPVSGVTWLDDGEHFLQRKDGKLLEVDAATGRATALYDPDAIADALRELPTIDKSAAKKLAKRRLTMNADRTAAVFEHENDLYYCRLDGTGAVRLSNTAERERHIEFSPNGKFVASSPLRMIGLPLHPAPGFPSKEEF